MGNICENVCAISKTNGASQICRFSYFNKIAVIFSKNSMFVPGIEGKFGHEFYEQNEFY